jgi:hypothetical protein
LSAAHAAEGPYLDPQAVALARLDLTKLDPDTLERFLRDRISALKLQDFVANLTDRNIRHLATRLRRLKQLNVERVDLVLTLYDLQAHYERLVKEPESFIYAVVPVPAGTDPRDVAQVLVEDPPGSGQTKASKHPTGVPRLWRGGPGEESSWFSLHFHSAIHLNDAAHDNVVLAGAPNVLDYLEKTSRDERPSAPAALTAAGEGPFQWIVAPPPVFSRAAREILGPVKLGELSIGDTLADGFKWAAFGVETKVATKEDSITARVVIQSRSAEGAKQMTRLIDLGFDAAVKQSKTKDARLAELTKLIELQVVGDQLHWRIDQAHTPPGRLAEALRPILLAQQVRLGMGQSINNMKHIALSFHNTHDVYKAFPTPANYDTEGKPLLSWRVHVLPFVDEGKLYREFRRDEPWDSEHNKKLIERMPAVYRRPFAAANTTKTPYQMPIGEKTVFQPGKKTTIRDIRDGTAKTIGLVEVDPEHEVIWTKPDDWEVNWADPTKGLTGGPGDSFVAGFLDGSVRAIVETIDKDHLRGLLTGNGGEPLPSFEELFE